MINTIKLFFLLIMACTVQSCATNHEPIRFGKDSCEHCKMLIMDPKFGAEIVTNKGKIYKFDDLNCMVSYMNKNSHNASTLAHILVIDFLTAEILIDATTAYYAFSDFIKSPMAGGVAAFHTMDARQRFVDQYGGTPMNWTDVNDKFK